MALTQITEKGIKDGEIINADINASAAIQGSKISPDFGSQNITTTGEVLIGTSTSQGNANANDLVVATSGHSGLTIRSGTSSNGNIFFADGTSGSDEYRGVIDYKHNGNSMSFSTDAVERMRIDSSGNVGIGTTSPSQLLSLKAASGQCQQSLTSATDQSCAIYFGDTSSVNRSVILHNNSDDSLAFNTAATERMRIHSSGIVTVGNDPSGAASYGGEMVIATTSGGVLTCADTGSGERLRLEGGSGLGRIGTDSNHALTFITNGTSNERMRIDTSGQIGMGTSSPVQQAGRGLHINGTDQTRIKLTNASSGATANDGFDIIQENGLGIHLINHENAEMKFGTNAAERMRIDSSGRVLLGVTSSQGNTDADNLQVGNINSSDASGITLGSTSNSSIRFADAGNATDGWVLYNHSDTSLRFGANNAERIRIDSSGRLLIGTTNNSNGHIAASNLAVQGADLAIFKDTGGDNSGVSGHKLKFVTQSGSLGEIDVVSHGAGGPSGRGGAMRFYTKANNTGSASERMRITNAGELLIGTTSGDIETLTSSGSGARFNPNGRAIQVASDAQPAASFNRTGDDGTVVQIRGQGSIEGTISVSGSAVSYNGGHLSRWSQFKGLSTTDKSARPTIYQGTVLSNLDDLCVWEGEDNQQLNMTKVSDVVGDKDVAGVFFTWDDDDDKVVNDFYVAMTGDMVIRVAASTTIARGDLLISAGDGTAKPQADDIVRSSTIAKITSINHTATYADGSKAYPCVLMAC